MPQVLSACVSGAAGCSKRFLTAAKLKKHKLKHYKSGINVLPHALPMATRCASTLPQAACVCIFYKLTLFLPGHP